MLKMKDRVLIPYSHAKPCFQTNKTCTSLQKEYKGKQLKNSIIESWKFTCRLNIQHQSVLNTTSNSHNQEWNTSQLTCLSDFHAICCYIRTFIHIDTDSTRYYATNKIQLYRSGCMLKKFSKREPTANNLPDLRPKKKKELFPIFSLSLWEGKGKRKLKIRRKFYQGSSFKDTTRACLLRFAALTKITDKQDGAHQGRWTFWSPFKQATGKKLTSVNVTAI